MRLLLTIVMAAIMALPAIGMAAQRIKVAHPNTPGTAHYRAWEDAKKFVDENSNGKYILDVYDSSKLGPTTTTMQGVQFGTIHVVEDGAPNFTGFDRAVGILDMPYLFPDYEAADAILYGPIGEKILDHLSQKSGARAMAFGANGFRGIFTNEKIENINDAKGMKIRSAPSNSHVESLRSLGFAPTPMPWPETVTGIQQRLINGFDFDLESIPRMQLAQITPYVYAARHIYTPHITVANLDWWEGLKGEDRELFQKMFDIYREKSLQYAREDDANAVEELKKAGHTVIDMTPEDRQKWMEAGKDVYKKLPDIPAEWMDEIRAKIKEMGKN